MSFSEDVGISRLLEPDVQSELDSPNPENVRSEEQPELPASGAAPEPSRGTGRSIPAPPAPAAPAEFEPTERLSELLVAYDGPLFRAELLESISRQIEEEGEILRAEGIMQPLQDTFDRLQAQGSLPESVRAVIQAHGERGRRAFLWYLGFRLNRITQKLVGTAEDDDARARSLQRRIDQMQELSRELEGSVIRS